MDITEFMEKNRENMLEDLKTIIEMETPSYNKKLLDNFASYFSSYIYKNLGMKPEIIQSKTNGNDIKVEFGDGEKILLLNHYDTVFGENTIDKRPFKITDNKIYGPGVFDMKSGIIETIYALRYLINYSKSSKKIVWLITSDEEIDSTFSRDIIIKNAENSKYVLVMESPLNGKLKTERKGVGTLKITVHGLSSHAGLDPDKGVNAITEMVNIITGVKNSGINGINFDVINGGSRSNVIPDLCEVEADLRFKTDDELNNIKKLIQSIKPLHDKTKIDYEYSVRPPMIKTSKTVDLFNNARKIAYDKLHINIEEVSVAGGSDGNFCSYYAPVLDGLGPNGSGAHSYNEFIYSESLPERSSLLYYLISDL